MALAVAAALFLGPVLDDLPQATLAALVIVAVLGLIKPAELVFLARFDRLELFVALLTAAVGLTAVPGLLVLRIGAPIYTANARGIQGRVLVAAAAADPPPAVVTLDATVVGGLSVTTLTVGRELERQLADQGAELWITSLPPRALAQAHVAPGWERLAGAAASTRRPRPPSPPTGPGRRPGRNRCPPTDDFRGAG